jgi:hypothetical protein
VTANGRTASKPASPTVRYSRRASLPEREVDYDWCVLEALSFVEQERQGKFTFGTKKFQEEYSYSRFFFLIEVARLYIDGLMGTEDVKVAINMLIDEMQKPMQKNSTQKLMEAKGEPPTSRSAFNKRAS